MTSPPIIFSEDFDLNLKPIQDSLMEKFRSFLGQNNNSNSNENNVNAQSFVNETIVEEKNHQGNQEKTNKKQDNFVIKKFKKCILDSDITLAEMLEKKTKFPNSTKKVQNFKGKLFNYLIKKKKD